MAKKKDKKEKKAKESKENLITLVFSGPHTNREFRVKTKKGEVKFTPQRGENFVSLDVATALQTDEIFSAYCEEYPGSFIVKGTMAGIQLPADSEDSAAGEGL